MRRLDEALSRLSEVQGQLSAFTRYTMMNEPTLAQLLARDVLKARLIVQELVSILDEALGAVDLDPSATVPADIRERIQRVKAYLEG